MILGFGDSMRVLALIRISIFNYISINDWFTKDNHYQIELLCFRKEMWAGKEN